MQTILYLQLVFKVGTQWTGLMYEWSFYVLASVATISHFHAHPDPVVSTIYEPMFILNNRRTNINTIAVSECLFESTLEGTVL